MSKALGITDDQLQGELYVAWLKDTRERPSPEALKKFNDVMARGIRDKEVVLRNSHVGVNVAITLSSILAGSHVTKIDLNENLIRDTGCDAIAHLLREAPNLTHLNLGGNDIGSHGLQMLSAVLATHRKLQVLILGSTENGSHVNRFDGTAAKNLLQSLSRSRTLKVLDLSRSPIGHTTQEALAVVPALLQQVTTLQVLKLASVEMQPDSGTAIVQAIAKASSLTSLDLHNNYLSHHVAEALGKIITERSARNMPNALKTLLLHQNPTLGERGAAPLFRALAADKGVSTLNLHSCNVDNAGLLVLCDSLATNNSLTFLDLHDNNLTDVSIVELARALARHPALTHLDLSYNKARDEGACALASLVECNTNLDTLNLEQCWIGDRGVIALGVGLAANTKLTALLLADNHVSDDGGTAFVALLDRNRSLQECTLKGNSVFHCTVMQANRLTARNQKIKQDDVPNRLRKEVIQLHYQMYKLEEAKNELEQQRSKKSEIDKAQERFEAQFRDEEAEFKKRRKDLADQLLDQENLCKELENQMKSAGESFQKFTVQHEGDVALLKERLDAEIRDRERAEEELRSLQAEAENADAVRGHKVEQLKKATTTAREERDHWAAQTKALRVQLEATQQRLKDMESAAALEAADLAAKAAREAEAKKSVKGDKKTKGASDIAALLAA